MAQHNIEEQSAQFDVDMTKRFNKKCKELIAEIHKVIIGQDSVILRLLTVLFAHGHALIIGVPGLAKTLMVKTLAGCLDMSFKRIQFTPDLMPSDITGTEILETDRETGERRMRFEKGPVFANFVLADEINRTPPKTQAALLEAMQEYTITAAGKTYHLDKPFFVVATQNPIEHEGTYPLPEAQLDRFMFSINIDYPDRDEEICMVNRTTSLEPASINAIFPAEELLAFQALVRRVPVSRHVTSYAADLARASRPTGKDVDSFIKEYVEWGAGPRSCQYLVLAAKVMTLMKGLPSPSTKEVREAAMPVLQHRVIPNYNATGEGIDSKQIVTKLLEIVSESDYSG